MIARHKAVIALLLGLALTGCDTLFPPGPTPTNMPVPLTILPASATVAPLAPTVISQDTSALNGEVFTPNAAPLGGDNLSTITPTSLATEAAISMQFTADDGTILFGTFYGAAAQSAPTILLLLMRGSDSKSWGTFPGQLRTAGYNVLTVDLRGSGATGGSEDWGKAPGDVGIILRRLAALPSVDSSRISLIGASIGANLSLIGCAAYVNCKSVVLLSPALDYLGLKAAPALAVYAKRPMLIIASQQDNPSGADSPTLDKLSTGDHQLLLFEGSAHGTALLASQPDLPGQIVQWLKAH